MQSAACLRRARTECVDSHICLRVTLTSPAAHQFCGRTCADAYNGTVNRDRRGQIHHNHKYATRLGICILKLTRSECRLSRASDSCLLYVPGSWLQSLTYNARITAAAGIQSSKSTESSAISAPCGVETTFTSPVSLPCPSLLLITTHCRFSAGSVGDPVLARGVSRKCVSSLVRITPAAH